MTNLNLKPSDIMYSQNSIGNKFKNGDQIGEVLDDIMEDRLSISKLPTIEVKILNVIVTSYIHPNVIFRIVYIVL
jgi:hypothetical protein